MSVGPSGRVAIVPHGKTHFEVRHFENEKDSRYRSWCLPLATAEAVTRWWLRCSPPLGEVPAGGEEPPEMETKGDLSSSVSLKEVKGNTDILARYQGTPIADWLRYHNLGEGRHTYDSPQLLIVTCMDFRISLHVPKRFAYVLRLAGANLCHREFDLACVLAFTGVRQICVVCHTDCAMESLKDRREDFASGLERLGGWSKTKAERQFDRCGPWLNVPNVVDFTLFQAGWLEKRYPGILVAPLIYDVKEGSLYQIVRQL